MRELIGESTWGQLEPAVTAALAGQATTFEAEVSFPKLGKRFSSGRLSPHFDQDGQVQGIVLLVDDITEERKSRLLLHEIEAYYSSLFNTPGVGHAEVDQASLTFLKVNRAMCDMLGYRQDELVGNKTVLDVTHPDDVELNQRVMAPVMRGEANHSELEKRYIRKDGTTIWASVCGTLLKGINGSPSRIFGFSQDITVRKRAEAVLAQAERNKDEFIATLAHELRNPLGAISNVLQLWQRSTPEPGTLVTIRDIIERQVGQLKHLIDDLLDLARISEGKIRLRPQKFDLQDALDSAIESVRPLVEARRHTLNAERSGRPIQLEGDPRRITQVFTNLLNNAAKYTPDGGEIMMCVNTIAPAAAQITIRDTGVGIDPSMLERIFDPFVQVDHKDDYGQSGLGIGLTLVRKIVALHDGTLIARSAGLGKGSEFVVTLPTL